MPFPLLFGFVMRAALSVRFQEIRKYLIAFAGCVYQNPVSICPQHQLILPRIIRSQIVTGRKRPQKKGV